jgi:hypothetical protein
LDDVIAVLHNTVNPAIVWACLVFQLVFSVMMQIMVRRWARVRERENEKFREMLDHWVEYELVKQWIAPHVEHMTALCAAELWFPVALYAAQLGAAPPPLLREATDGDDRG